MAFSPSAFVHGNTAISGASQPINTQLVKTVDVLDTPALANFGPHYYILFTFKDGTPDQKWEYASASARNTAYAAFKTTASNNI